jgi:hypothetical protein
MNVVDSSAWLEYLAAGPNAVYFSAAIENWTYPEFVDTKLSSILEG